MKIKIILSILFITFITGCTAEKAMEESAQANPKIEIQAAIEMPHRSQVGELMDNATISDVEPDTRFRDYSYVYDSENVINFEEVWESWNEFLPRVRSFGHEYEVEDRVTDDYIPKEIIDVLTALNNGNRDEETFRDIYKNYLAKDCVYVDPDDRDKLAEFVNPDDLYFLDVYNVSSMIFADIDYDNKNEYLAEVEFSGNGGTWATSFHIYDTKEEEVDEVCHLGPRPHIYDVGDMELLKIDNKYFMLGNSYAGFYDPRKDSWAEVGVERDTTSYTIYEFYSNTQLEEEKLLEGIDLLGGEAKGWKKQDKEIEYYYSYGGSRFTPDDSSWPSYPWVLEQNLDGGTYYYVLSDFASHNLNNLNDRILFVIKETDNGKFEIVKAYYLVADLKLVIEERQQ